MYGRELRLLCRAMVCCENLRALKILGHYQGEKNMLDCSNALNTLFMSSQVVELKILDFELGELVNVALGLLHRRVSKDMFGPTQVISAAVLKDKFAIKAVLSYVLRSPCLKRFEQWVTCDLSPVFGVGESKFLQAAGILTGQMRWGLSLP